MSKRFNEKAFNKEKLHALADDQLDTNEATSVLQHIENDKALQSDLCDIRRIKDLVKHSYPLEDCNERPHPKLTLQRAGKVAAVLLLVLGGFSAGWLTKHESQPSAVIATTTPPAISNKTIVFIGYSDSRRFEKTLATAESILNTGQKDNAEVYIVASSGGIDLMRSSVSPYQGKIKALLKKYEKLNFVACNNTIYRYKQEGKVVNLIEEVEVAPSAVEFVAERMRLGWNYVSI